jgi:hypothetical protein
MKHSKIMLFLGVLIVGFIIPSFAQETLPEVTVSSVRYKYLSAVDNKDLPAPVKILERKAAEFDVKNSEFYDDEYDEYHISFYLPSGYILATYDRDGKLLRTAEKYKKVAMPPAVAQAVAKRFPQWTVPNDMYLVTYQEGKEPKKVWKLVLQNGDKRLRVKTDDKGEFLD